MRLSTWLFILLIPIYSIGYGQSERTVSISGTFTLQKIFQKIEQQTGKRIFYANNILNDQEKINIKVVNKSISEVLSQILTGKKLEWSVEPKFITIVAIRNQPTTLNEADTTITVTGRVTDDEGVPISGATVLIKGTTNGITTNQQGFFTIKNAPKNAFLIVSSIGYLTEEIPPNSRNNIRLKTYVSVLDEKQIIAYGQTSRRLNTGNVISVKAAEIEDQPVANPLLALQARVPGVEIIQNNGVPGGGARILIRGRNTLSQGTDPLYIINGLPYSPVLFGNPENAGINGIQGINPFSFLNPSEIESIDILKDADATAIYGSRAANGVILITTKKGKEGKTTLNINVQSGIGKVARKAKLMNTAQYLEMRTEAFKNDDAVPDITNARDLVDWDQHAYTDWQKVMIGNTARYTDIQTSVSGGNENTQFLVGAGYHKETTVFPGDWADKKASIHFNINNTSLNERFRISLSGSFLNDINNLPGQDFTAFILMSPNAPALLLPDGTPDWDNYSDNPFRVKVMRYESRTTNLISNALLSYNLLPGLDIKTTLGYNNIQISENARYPTTAFNPGYGISTGFANFNNNTLYTWIAEPQLTYKTDIGKGRLDALLGVTIQQRRTDGQVMTGTGYTDNDLLGTLAAANDVIKGATAYERYKYNSVFARVGYNWNNRYLINLTARRDGSSRFGPGKQFGNFGAIGAGWIFSNETFIREALPFLSFGKIRASYGSSGNEPAWNYQYLELFDFRQGNPYGNGGSIFPANLPVPDFSWEINKKLEAGLETGFLKDRIIASVSLYRNRSSNQLISLQIPIITGFSTVVVNFPALVQNRGIEFMLNTTNIKSKHFNWKSSLNLTAPQNQLLSYPDLENSIYRQTYTIGQPIAQTMLSAKVYPSAGVDPATGSYVFYDSKGNITSNPAFLTDNTVLINPFPTLYGGMTNNFQYKNFQLDITLQYVRQTGKNYLYSTYAPGSYYDGNGNQSIEVLKRWQKPGDQQPYQKYTQSFDPGFYDYAANSNAAYSDASFLRVKNVALSYNLSASVLRKLKIDHIKAYLHAQNLFTFSGYKGVDPENQSLLYLPPLRVITAGIQFNL